MTLAIYSNIWSWNLMQIGFSFFFLLSYPLWKEREQTNKENVLILGFSKNSVPICQKPSPFRFNSCNRMTKLPFWRQNPKKQAPLPKPSPILWYMVNTPHLLIVYLQVDSTDSTDSTKQSSSCRQSLVHTIQSSIWGRNGYFVKHQRFTLKEASGIVVGII